MSDAEGNYFLSELPPGALLCHGRALGLHHADRVRSPRVEVSQNQRVDIRLAVGS